MARAGHGMVLNENISKFYIIGGTRSKTEMNDFIEFDILTEGVTTIHSGFGKGAPPLGVTHRTIFDPESNEIRLVISSARNSRDSMGNEHETQSTYYFYDFILICD